MNAQGHVNSGLINFIAGYLEAWVDVPSQFVEVMSALKANAK